MFFAIMIAVTSPIITPNFIQTCSESQKGKSSQSHDFDSLFLPKILFLKSKPNVLKYSKLLN